MFKKIIFLLFAFLLAACSAGQKPSPTPAPDANVEEQAVLSAVLKKLYNAPNYVIMENTATDPGGVANTQERIDYIMKNMHDVDKATIANFTSSNSESHPVLADMNLGAPYVVLSVDQRSQIFGQNQSGWETFYKNYPDAPGITEISRVGFNTNYTQALVYVGTQSYFLAGAGYYLLLNKVDGAWTVDQQVMSWIS